MDRFKPEFLKFADRTIQLLREAVAGDVLSLPFLDRNVIWIAHNDAVYVDKENVASYLKDIVKRLGKTLDLDVSFVKEITADCLSVTGRLSFGAGHHAFEETDVCFHVIWTRGAEDWTVKQVVTSDEKRFFRNENKGENSAFDLGSLYDRLPAGIIGCMDNPLLTVQMLNPIMLTVLEYESLEELKEYTGTSLYSLIHPDDLQKMRDFVEAVKSAGSREILTVRIRKKDFSYAWLQLTGDLFQKDLFIFLGMDYSEQYRLNERLHTQSQAALGRERDYRKILENIPGGFYGRNLFEPVKLNYVSESLSRITGYTVKEVLEDQEGEYTELLFPEDRETFLEASLRLMEYPHVERTCYRILTKDGKVVPVIDIGQSVRGDDGRMYGYSTVQEIELFAAPAPAEAIAQETEGSHIEVRTFGSFSVSIYGEELRFRSEKARELLAILVDYRGDFVNQRALISRLWPGEAVNKLTLARLRKTFKNLQDELMKYGLEDIIESQKGHRRIVPEKVDCDYFAYCTGKPQYQHLYQGRYMMEYAWTEETLAGLNRLKEEQLLQMSNSHLTRFERNKSENKNASEVP